MRQAKQETFVVEGSNVGFTLDYYPDQPLFADIVIISESGNTASISFNDLLTLTGHVTSYLIELQREKDGK